MSTFPDKALIKSTIRERVRGERRYNPHGTRRMEALAGTKLASFKHRFWAFLIDSALIAMLMMPFGSFVDLGISKYFTASKENKPAKTIHVETTHADPNDPTKQITEKRDIPVDEDKDDEEEKNEKKTKEFVDPVFALIYYGFFLKLFNGRTPGKKWMGIRVVSLIGERLTLWQACERTLGYGASALEGGFGFVQFFINPNRCCVHDRIAETIVIEDPPREAKAAQQEAKIVKEVALLEAEEAREIDEEVLGQAALESTDIQ
jgi:uncharacterized RDD family membrane protein YckC